VFYRSNRHAKNERTLDFASDLPLWPGSNMVTIVARENNDVRSVKTVYVYKDAPRTAATP
jgi:carboxyl-terminal processing protease